MTAGNKAVFFNAVPLFVLAAAYLAVSAALAPRLWRERARLRVNDVALALMFPCIGIPLAIFGAVVVHARKPIGGHLWVSFAASVIALVPALLFLIRWGERAELVTTGARAREAEELVTARGRELEAVAAISDALARTNDPETAGRVLLDEVSAVFGVEFTALALIHAEQGDAQGLLARQHGRDLRWWRDTRLSLRDEPSGIASAYFQAAPVIVYDCDASPLVSPRLVEAVGAKSGAFVPLIVEQRVIGVLVAAPTSQKRAFTSDEVTLMQALAAETALALERTRSAGALDEALARERLVGDISRRVRSTQGVESGSRVAVTEIGRALRASRCFIRVGGPGDELHLLSEWFAAGLQPIGPQTKALPVTELAARARRTVSIADIEQSNELRDTDAAGLETFTRLGTKAVLAAPMVAFGELIGVLGLHRAAPGPWSEAEVALAEAVARELALAIHSGRLLDENARRLVEQTSLLRAAQVVTSELELDAVLQRLVDEVAALVGCEAADCYLLDRERGVLRCEAVHGLEAELVGFEFAADRGLAGRAIELRQPALSTDYSDLPDAVPHRAYRGYVAAIVAPMVWSGEIRGVLGIGTRDPDRAFRASDAELLQTFATLAALALRNAESFEERSRQARIQRAFYDIASVLSAPISQAETMRAVARAATQALGGGAAVLLLPHGDTLAVAAGFELRPELSRLLADPAAANAEPFASCARSGNVLAAPALAEDDRFARELRAAATTAGYESLLAVPVDAPGGRGGLAVVFFNAQRRFSDYELELAQNLAGAARAALERSELFESERRARALAQQLARTGGLLSTDLDPAAVLDEIVAQAPALLAADAAVVRLLEEEELVVSAASGDVPADLVDARAPATGWAGGDAVQMRSPVVVANAVDEAGATADPVVGAGFPAFLAVPLAGAEGGLQGVLTVYAKQPRPWRQDEVEALTALAANASAALASAELYQRVALEKERSVAILANIADGIVAVDREGRVVLWNAAAEQISGIQGRDALGKTTLQVLQRTLESDETQGDGIGDRLVSIRRGDDEVWLSVTEAIMRDPAGAVAGRIFAFRDVSSERVVERMKSDFVAAVSHELRTPLTSIYGFAETLLRQDVLFGEEERRTFLGYIASESERLTGIVDQLLNVARLDTGDLQVNLAATDVRTVVEDVVETARELPQSDGRRFVVELPDEPLEAEADREKLRQILANLVDNAVKFSPDDGIVTIAAQRVDERVELRVADEGVGIPEDEQRRIFTRFYRGGPVERDPGAGGTGLGLFIAQGLVSAMAGRIWVESREGEGATFLFELPLAADRTATRGSERSRGRV
jgi:PAS domain S-box-containing protein